MQAEHTFCLTALTIKAAYVNKKGLMNGWYTGRYAFRYTGSLLLPIWSLQSTAHLKPFLRNFFVTKNTCATLRAQVTRASKIWLWIFKACFMQITSSKIECLFWFDWFFFFSMSSISFDCWTQSMNWIRLSSIGLDWNLVRLGSIYYTGILKKSMAARHLQSSVQSNAHINSPVSPHPHPRCGNISNHYFPFWCFAHGVPACIYGLVRKDTGHNRR